MMQTLKKSTVFPGGEATCSHSDSFSLPVCLVKNLKERLQQHQHRLCKPAQIGGLNLSVDHKLLDSPAAKP